MRKKMNGLNLCQNNGKVIWRERVHLKDKRRKYLEGKRFLDLGEQQHMMTLAPWRISQLERDWKKRQAQEGTERFYVNGEVSNGGLLRE
jgi:hypothetical protein